MFIIITMIFLNYIVIIFVNEKRWRIPFCQNIFTYCQNFECVFLKTAFFMIHQYVELATKWYLLHVGCMDFNWNILLLVFHPLASWSLALCLYRQFICHLLINCHSTLWSALSKMSGATIKNICSRPTFVYR